MYWGHRWGNCGFGGRRYDHTFYSVRLWEEERGAVWGPVEGGTVRSQRSGIPHLSWGGLSGQSGGEWIWAKVMGDLPPFCNVVPLARVRTQKELSSPVKWISWQIQRTLFVREPLLRQLTAAGFVFQKYCSSQNGAGYWCGSSRCRLVKHCNLSWESLTAAFWWGQWMWSGRRARSCPASCAIPDVPGDRELWCGCEVRRRDGKGGTGLFQMPLGTDSCQSHSGSCIYVCCLWTWILVCSRPEIWGMEGAEAVDWGMLQ